MSFCGFLCHKYFRNMWTQFWVPATLCYKTLETILFNPQFFEPLRSITLSWKSIKLFWDNWCFVFVVVVVVVVVLFVSTYLPFQMAILSLNFSSLWSKQFAVSGFERACHLFRTRRYKVVSPSDYAISLRTPNVQCCLVWPVSRKDRNENKIKLCFWWISNVNERLFRSGIVSRELYHIGTFGWDIFKLNLVARVQR